MRPSNPIYLDCCASTPVEASVADLMYETMIEHHGNAGSRTHIYGAHAKSMVEDARKSLAEVARSRPEEVIFTSGATESNNIAILGLASSFEPSRHHVVTSSIEHKAVLEPIGSLEERGFAVTRVPVSSSGAVDPEDVRRAIRPETILVSIMHVNNETGVRQPIGAIGKEMGGHGAYFHSDGSQGFAWDDDVSSSRVDMISISGHKMFAPQGIGALVLRRRGFEKPPLKPLLVGGGQERGLRPGTLPVPLIAALGKAARLVLSDRSQRLTRCQEIRLNALTELNRLEPKLNGDQSKVLSHVLNLRFEGVDSEALMVALKATIACSNGSACTSASYRPSHVLMAMGLSEDEAASCVRLSWCHLTPNVDWPGVVAHIRKLM